MARLQALPLLTYTVKHHCVERLARDRHLDGRAVLGAGGDGRAHGAGPLPALRLLRRRLLQRLRSDQRHASADDHRVRLQRPAAHASPRRPGPLYAPVKLGYKE